jgi:hypothetical protein
VSSCTGVFRKIPGNFNGGPGQVPEISSDIHGEWQVGGV